MSWFLCTVSRDSPRNWDLCKEVSTWGVSTRLETFRMPKVNPGDHLLVWIAGVGFRASATVTEAPRKPVDRSEAPWPGGLHRFGAVIPFKLDLELSEPLRLRFENHRQAVSGLNLFQFRRGFVIVPDTAGEAVATLMREAAEEQAKAV